MKKTGFIKLLAVASLFGLILPIQSVSADSAFSWGHWEGGKDMALTMTSGDADTNLNNTECLRGMCALDNNPVDEYKPANNDTLVACELGATNKTCHLGPKVSQY